MDIKYLEQKLRWLVWGIVLFLIILVAFNGEFFGKQINYWWQQDLQNKGFDVAEISGIPDRISIPQVGIESPIIYVDTVEEPRLQEALVDGVVHYLGTANPGEYGNAYLFGHSSNLPTRPGQYKTVFALLSQLREGDEIFVTNRIGTKYTYKIFDKKIIKPTQLEVLDQGDRKKRILTLQTSYPLGMAIWRYIVLAEMV